MSTITKMVFLDPLGVRSRKWLLSRSYISQKRYWRMWSLRECLHLVANGTANPSRNSSHSQHPTYLLLRVEAIPLSLILSFIINRISHSILTIWSTLLACSTLFLAIYPSVHQITFENVVLGSFLSVLTALFPILLLKTSHTFYNTCRLKPHPADELDTEPGKKTPSISNQEGLRAFWSILRLVALISLLVIVPVLLLSGELQDIHSNSYVLDLKLFWLLVAASGTTAGLLLILTLWLVRATSPVTTIFMLVPSSGLQVAILNHFSLPLYNWVDIVMCWGSSLYFFVNKRKESVGKAMSSNQKISCVLYNVILPVILYMGVLYATHLSQAGTGIMAAGNEDASHRSQFLALINRTDNAYGGQDDYLGPRPHVDTVADLNMMVEQCKEVDGGKGVDDVVNCLSYLTNSEQEYLSLPGSDKNLRASEQDPREAHFLNADRHGNTRSRYIPPSRAQAASISSIGTCAGPIVPFHVYWTGPASWRVELFIKAYLYTQNLPCSRLWLWLDADIDPDAVERMHFKDAIFDRFRPLVDRGDIVLKVWKFPSRVPIPADHTVENEDTNPSGSEKVLSKGIVQDANGQKWLVFDPSRIALSPVVVSDAVRFILLHLYGGLYCDMDVLLLRDMRPMILPDPASGQRAFAEQWVERCYPGDYNTAVISLPANSSLSTYLLSGGLRMGLNFHPRMIGRMLWRDGRSGELAQLHNAVFDPLVTNLRRKGTNTCTVPCHKNFQSAFMRQVEEAPNEWSNYRGEHVGPASDGDVREEWSYPTNRSLENFFRGSWAYHIHNQVSLVHKNFFPLAKIHPIPFTSHIKRNISNHLTLFSSSTVVEIPRTPIMDGRHHACPRQIFHRPAHKCLW